MLSKVIATCLPIVLQCPIMPRTIQNSNRNNAPPE